MKKVKVLLVLLALSVVVACGSNISATEYKAKMDTINEKLNKDMADLSKKITEIQDTKSDEYNKLFKEQFTLRGKANDDMIALKGPKDFSKSEKEYDKILKDYSTLFNKYPNELMDMSNPEAKPNEEFNTLIKKIQDSIPRKLELEKELQGLIEEETKKDEKAKK